MKSREENADPLQRNLLRILSVTSAQWNLTTRKRTRPRAVPRAALTTAPYLRDCGRWIRLGCESIGQ
jgi:hypothetical protein